MAGQTSLFCKEAGSYWFILIVFAYFDGRQQSINEPLRFSDAISRTPLKKCSQDDETESASPLSDWLGGW